MMKKYIAAGLISLAATTAHADEIRPWTTTEKTLGVAALVLHTIDWRQTSYIAKNPHRFHETNPLIGRYPSTGRVNGYFLASGLVIAGLAHYFPEWRPILLGVYVGGQIANTHRNYQLGLRVSF